MHPLIQAIWAIFSTVGHFECLVKMSGHEESKVLQAAQEDCQQYMTLQHSCSKDEETLCDRCMQPINARIIEENMVVLKVKSYCFGMMRVCLPHKVGTGCAFSQV